MKRPKVNYKICVACGICVAACPVSCLTLSKIGIDKLNKAYPEISENPRNNCIGCSICFNNCPLDAIEMEDI